MRRLPPDRLRPNEVEAAIADLPFERLYFFGADGRQVAIFDGDEAIVFFRLSSDELRHMRGGHLIHNHPPRDFFPRSDPRYDALSFSSADWRVAADLDVAETIVVTPAWKYVLRRPDPGWLAVDKSPDEIESMIKILSDHITREDALNVRLRNTTTDLAEATRSHRINTRYAGEIGATYRRERQ
jgi:hypothetical protein